jgi:hypothetical protein
MNWKGFVRKRSWPSFKVQSQHSPGGSDENHEKLGEISSFHGGEYEVQNCLLGCTAV